MKNESLLLNILQGKYTAIFFICKIFFYFFLKKQIKILPSQNPFTTLKNLSKTLPKTLLFFVIFLNPEYTYTNYTFYTYNTNNTYKKLFV